ncbi:baseplate assembly protein [Acinetobacter seifertii]|uniref:Baseplate J/gp47 family protein n=1 Tax=Acinetobacter seifertii TaxID=1530123 RepID=A0A7H2V929_9GAMM|nr:baseplate J/gp47 family protein [Acinetobacter seifertii]QNX72862.1 baseplate J/gp47 family protein [Acinetobacter seifertii]
MSVDFSQLSKPNIIEEIDFETLYSQRKENLIALYNTEDQSDIRETLSRESEPLVKFLQENSYREVLLRNRINQAALSTLLAFAEKTDLDAVVANYGITRLLISPATSDLDAVYESDDALRYRASLVFDSLSVAGPTSAYEFHALTSDGRVSDAKASSPSPAEALVTILQNDTQTGEATPELISIVEKYLSDDIRRPVGDRLKVQSVEAIHFELVATVYTNNLPESDSLVQASKVAIQNYFNESRRIGRSIYLSKIYNLLHVSGVVHVAISSPQSDVEILSTQVANCTNITINAGEV